MIKKLNNIIKITIIFCFVFPIYSQQSNYVVITFESMDSQKEIIEYNWIVPTDSINEKIKIYPLYMDIFSRQDLIECENREKISILTMSEGEDYNLDDNIMDDVNDLKKIILNRKKKIQTLTKKWSNGRKEKIKVYITPITGDFCVGQISNYSGKFFNYYGIIFLPKYNFNYNEAFYNSNKFKIILNEDFMSYKIKTR